MKKKELSTFLTCLTFISLSLALVATGCPLQPSPTSNPCRVVFQTGEGQGTAPYPQIVVEGHIIELPGQEAMTHPSGKILSKWRSDDGTTYNPYYRYTVTRNVEFTAQWIASTSTFTVAFSANNGIGTPPESKSVQAGSIITLPNEGGLSRSGYTFGGWNTNSSGTGTNYSAGATFTPSGNTILYAKWNNTSTLSAPTGVTVTKISEKGIRVSWNTVSGATYYLVHNSWDPDTVLEDGATSVINGETTFTTDAHWHPGHTLYICVTAVNNEGEGPPSSMVSVTF